MRAAIYARYSSENQRPERIEDQIGACRLRRGSEKVFQAPPIEWIEERLAGMQEVKRIWVTRRGFQRARETRQLPARRSEIQGEGFRDIPCLVPSRSKR